MHLQAKGAQWPHTKGQTWQFKKRGGSMVQGPVPLKVGESVGGGGGGGGGGLSVFLFNFFKVYHFHIW